MQEGVTVTPETEEYGIGSFVYRARRPFHPQRLHDFVTGHMTLQEPELADSEDSEEDEGGSGEGGEPSEEGGWTCMPHRLPL